MVQLIDCRAARKNMMQKLGMNNEQNLASFGESNTKKFFELSSDIFVIIDRQGYFRYVNSAWEEALGWTNEEMCGCLYSNFVFPDDLEATLQEMARVIHEKKTAKNFVNRYRGKNGGYRWLLSSFSLHKDHVYCVARDITEMKEQEILLQETSALAETGGWNYVVATKKLIHSPEISRIFGIDPNKKYTPESTFPFYNEPHRGEVMRAFERAKDQAIPFDFEVEITRESTGEKRWIRLIGRPEVKNGCVQRVIGLCQDITVRKEERMGAMYAGKMASLGEMAGGIAHEINNPLTIISMRTHQIKNLLEKGGLEEIPRVIQLLGVVDVTIGRIASIIRGLRFFARSGDQDPFEKTKLETIIKDTLALCRERLAQCGIELSIGPYASDLEIECRPVQISQILLNLLNNALSAVLKSPDNQRWIRIEVETSHDLLRLKTIDSGPGVPEAIRHRIMEPFFTTKKIGEGTGLGLSISKGIAEEHGGRLYMNEKTEHTCFILELHRYCDSGSPSNG